jgi:hypothetical protein
VEVYFCQSGGLWWWQVHGQTEYIWLVAIHLSSSRS